MKHKWTLWLYPGATHLPVMQDEHRAVEELFTWFSQMLLKAVLWDWQNELIDSGHLIQVLYDLETVPEVDDALFTRALNRLSTAVLSVTVTRSQSLLDTMNDPASSPSTL